MPDAPRPLAHVVFFTLKDRTSENVQKLIDSCQEHLTGHEGTLFYGAGPRGEEFDRPVNDSEYDVGLHVIFDSKASQDAYQGHERHQQFIAANKESWAQIRVFDTYL
ncbi:Stress responsive A/B Barrel Domain protein [Pseudobythopirellula maris]|uniref:Stress responsive A/B Barrel Domain protein n=1 Tax=Pseudobythopirellula maris TaxID=2527991 RepID=A0A5C5ZNU0_9BACT|nr:Dabb family protein [Pseudobythopirellula maris]TWT88577.1 Stress responsive A/B Barrel Domain protein [Pseudobythopirellula maris]